MSGKNATSASLILDALRGEASRRSLASVLLIGMQSCSTVTAANALLGAENVVLLHLDRTAGAVGCGLGNREVYFGDEIGTAGRPDRLASFSVVAVDVEAAKSYRLLREVVRQTARYLETDGTVLIAGPRKGGAEVAARALGEAFESVTLVSYRKGHRVYRAVRPRQDERRAGDAAVGEPGLGRTADVSPGRIEEIETIVLRGRELRLLADDRIFARGRLDPATKMLADAFESVPPGSNVLDLGAGSGVLGILAALLEPSCHAWLVDSDPLAVQVSRRNAVLNGVCNVSVQLSDALQDLPDQRFDVVLMNPPFHRGRAHDTSIAERFVAESSRALGPGGAVYVVCNRFLRYEPVLEQRIGPVREVAGDRQYKVLLARQPGLAPPLPRAGEDVGARPRKYRPSDDRARPRKYRPADDIEADIRAAQRAGGPWG